MNSRGAVLIALAALSGAIVGPIFTAAICASVNSF